MSQRDSKKSKNIKSVQDKGEITLSVDLGKVTPRMLQSLLSGVNKPYNYTILVSFVLKQVEKLCKELSKLLDVPEVLIFQTLRETTTRVELTQSIVRKSMTLMFMEPGSKIRVKYDPEEKDDKTVYKTIWVVANNNLNRSLFSGIITATKSDEVDLSLGNNDGTGEIVENRLVEKKEVSQKYLTVEKAKDMFTSNKRFRGLAIELKTDGDMVDYYAYTEEILIALDLAEDVFKKGFPSGGISEAEQELIDESIVDLEKIFS